MQAQESTVGQTTHCSQGDSKLKEVPSCENVTHGRKASGNEAEANGSSGKHGDIIVRTNPQT